MSKLKKQPRPKAETPKGFRDYFGYELIQRQRLLNDISEVYQLYGFSALESSAVETVEALGKFLPDIDRPNEGVFAWEEDDTWLALRYDLTAPLARVYASLGMIYLTHTGVTLWGRYGETKSRGWVDTDSFISAMLIRLVLLI